MIIFKIVIIVLLVAIATLILAIHILEYRDSKIWRDDNGRKRKSNSKSKHTK